MNKLYDAWQIEKKTRISLKQTVRRLQQQILEMKRKLQQPLGKKINPTTMAEQKQVFEYFTDEEKLIKETE